MNYLAYVSWGMYGGTTATMRANLFGSWGLMDALPGYTAPLVYWISIFGNTFGSILGG